MALDPNAAGQVGRPLSWSWTWQDAVRYALAVGAGPEELPYVYERYGPRVLPSMLVLPSFAAASTLFHAVKGDATGAFFAEQQVVFHRALPPEGSLEAQPRVVGVWDLKRLAMAGFEVELTDAQGPLATSRFSLVYAHDGGFGGARPPRPERFLIPQRAEDWTARLPTLPQQALLYRLLGDLNPLHVDPEAAAEAQAVTGGRPILHGLCTFGFLTRAVLAACCGGDPGRLRSLSCRFAAPAWPGDTLCFEGWREGPHTLVRVRTAEAPEREVLTNVSALVEGEA